MSFRVFIDTQYWHETSHKFSAGDNFPLNVANRKTDMHSRY